MLHHGINIIATLSFTAAVALVVFYNMAEFVYFRYVLVVIAFYCMVVVNLTRSSFNVAILKMIDNNCTGENPPPDTFCWSKGKFCSHN